MSRVADSQMSINFGKLFSGRCMYPYLLDRLSTDTPEKYSRSIFPWARRIAR